MTAAGNRAPKDASERNLTRKEARKASKKLKKLKRVAYSAKKPVQQVLKETFGDQKKAAKKKRRKEREKEKRRLKREEKEAESDGLDDVDYTPAAIEHERQRMHRDALMDDEAEVKRIYKQLGYKKRKTKALPKVFAAEGLDDLLDLCNSIETKTMQVEDEKEFVGSRKTGKNKHDMDDDEDEMDASDGSGEDDDDDILGGSDDSDMGDSDEDLVTERPPEPCEVQPLKTDIYGRPLNKDEEESGENAAEKSEESSENRPWKLGQPAETKTGAQLVRHVKGLINRVSEHTISGIGSQLKKLYSVNSRNEVKTALIDSLLDSIFVSHALPDRILMEYAAFVAYVHCTISDELSAYLVESLVCRWRDVRSDDSLSLDDKHLINSTLFLCRLAHFKVIKCNLIMDMLRHLLQSIDQRAVELMLIVLKDVGFVLRKDNAAALKDFIVDAQRTAASQADDMDGELVELVFGMLFKSRMSSNKMAFMLEALMAIKNNNVAKLGQPTHDPDYLEHLHKLMRGILKGGRETSLGASLSDYWNAADRGRWWLVGSAWSKPDDNEAGNSQVVASNKLRTLTDQLAQFEPELLAMAAKHRMNTDIKRAVFCSMISADDVDDAFERVQRLNLKARQEREIIHVALYSSLKERTYNEFYGDLMVKFARLNRQFAVTLQFALWDKLRDVDRLSSKQQSNLVQLCAQLIWLEAIGLDVFRVFAIADQCPQTAVFGLVLNVLFAKSLASGGAASSKWASIVARCARKPNKNKQSQPADEETVKSNKKKDKKKLKKQKGAKKGKKDKTPVVNEDLQKEHAVVAKTAADSGSFIDAVQTYLNASMVPDIEHMSDHTNKQYMAIVDKINVLCENVN